MVHKIRDMIPEIHQSAFIAHNAEVAGQVTIGEGASVWFSATVRGDIAPISIGKNSNVQDGAVVHCDTDIPCVIGEGVTVGHGAIVHSATVGDNTVVGMGAIILNKAVIGADSIVGAGSLVTGGKEFPPRSMIIGSPAKVTRELTGEEVERNRANALHYVEKGSRADADYGVVEQP